MTGVTGGAGPRRSLRLRSGLLASLTGIAVLAAACTGGSRPASSSSPAMAAGAAGPFVYVADTKSNKISEYSASPSTFGALQPLSPSTVPTGPFPYTVGVDPQGTSAYALSSADEVSQYTIDPRTGNLTPKSPPTATARVRTSPAKTTPRSRNTPSTQSPGGSRQCHRPQSQTQVARSALRSPLDPSPYLAMPAAQ
jgi:DNA-binding beta-propeller fold protein YncE